MFETRNPMEMTIRQYPNVGDCKCDDCTGIVARVWRDEKSSMYIDSHTLHTLTFIYFLCVCLFAFYVFFFCVWGGGGGGGRDATFTRSGEKRGRGEGGAWKDGVMVRGL